MNKDVEKIRALIKECLDNSVKDLFSNKFPNRFMIQEIGSTGRSTDVWTEKDIPDIDFSLRFRKFEDQDKFNILIKEFSKKSNNFIRFLKSKGINATIKDIVDFGKVYPDRYKCYLKIGYLLITDTLNINLEVNLSIWPFENYVDIFNKQIKEIKKIGGQRAVKRVILDIRKMKKLLKKHNLYRSKTNLKGVKGVAIEQWIIQSGCYKNKLIQMKSVGSFQKALGWILRVANYPTSLEEIPMWKDVQKKFCVMRSYGENVKEEGCFFNKIRDKNWRKLISLSLKCRKNSGSIFILLCRDNKILMQLRDQGDKKYFGKWCFPGGFKLSYENYKETAIREALEEYNLNLSKDRVYYLGELHNQGTLHKSKIFIFRINNKEKKGIIMKEGKSMKWMSLNEIKKLSLGHEHSKIIPLIDKYLNSRDYLNLKVSRTRGTFVSTLWVL